MLHHQQHGTNDISRYVYPGTAPTAKRGNVIGHTPLFTGYEAYALIERLTPQPVKVNIELTDKGLFVEPSVIYREYDLEHEMVYLPKSKDRIVRLRPAFGETYRNPKNFVAIVLVGGNEKRSKTVAISAGQKLMVA